MKKILLVVGLAAAAVLAACSPSGGAEPEAAAKGETKTLYVGPELVDCVGVAPMQCMQVKENPDGEYQLFYNNIEGFTFEPGYEYVLRVSVETIDNPPADGSSLKYTLVEEVSRTPVETSEAEADMTETTGDLIGTLWALVSYRNDAGETVEALPGVDATLEFGDDGQLGGNGSCNNFFASYTVEGDSLTIGQAGSTMMACGDEIMAQETQYLANLQAAATYRITGDELQILDADGNTILTFRAEEPMGLTGTTWVATGYNNGRQAVVSILADTTITAVFGDDGRFNGLAGCNNYMGGYTVEGESITIEPPASTRKLCPAPEGVMEQEAAYLTALTTAATYRISGDKLELRTADGALVASYVAQPAE